MPYENVKIDLRDGILFLTIDRPNVLNALNAETVEEIYRVFAAALRGQGQYTLRVFVDGWGLTPLTPAQQRVLQEARALNAQGVRLYRQARSSGLTSLTMAGGRDRPRGDDGGHRQFGLGRQVHGAVDRGEAVFAARAFDTPTVHLVGDHELVLARRTIDAERHGDTCADGDETLSWSAGPRPGKEKMIACRLRTV